MDRIVDHVRRVYVEKKAPYAVKAKELHHEIESYLGMTSVRQVRVLIRYDVENLSDEIFEIACHTVFSEPPVDDLYLEIFPRSEAAFVFSVEYLPGQFDQRADSAVQCLRFLKEDEEPIIRTATTYVIEGELTEEEKQQIRSYCMNPVDSRVSKPEKPLTLAQLFENPADVSIVTGFKEMDESQLSELYASFNLAMTMADFRHIQSYFRTEEKRDPSMTEIRVLDTYWSDHCRHTTFSTEIKDITFGEGDYLVPIRQAYDEYLKDRKEIYGSRKDKSVCLMDLALMAMKKLKAEGKLADQEESEEINACSIVVPVDVDGVTEEWLVNFKNETHNHPTEIEPFGGAATCLGGAIRDPLSGRTYVYQAMRVTGAADPTVPVQDTRKGKLPQKKLVREAARGYSSYGNQIGLATGYVHEIYHPAYVAKRMEIGAVMGAAPRRAVIRATSDPEDVIILLGGRTGRDGIGGATGSSKVHTTASIDVCGAEVQKGNAPTERKLQRMFRREEVSLLIKKCNDFGAGGVSVAIGELAPGLWIDLDKVPKKYAGLDGTELAISESQERMAVVVAPENVEQFLAYAAEENLEAVTVAKVTKDPRLVMVWRGKEIVNLSRAFLDTNGAHQETEVYVDIPSREGNPLLAREDVPDVRGKWLAMLSDLNACSQKGLVEMFDSSIGAGSVLMPYGGKLQLTQTQAMVAKIPVLKGKTHTVSMMSYGFDPYVSSHSPFHGAAYAVTESVARILACGGDYHKIRFTFQEYFGRMTDDPHRWGWPVSALLGAYAAQLGFGLPSIGGKDSMSGSFDDLDVPPTLVSFAVDIAKTEDVITPELKNPGDKLIWFRAPKDAYDLPDYPALKEQYDKLMQDMKAGRIAAAYALDRQGLAKAVTLMAFGNALGVKIEHNLDPRDFFAPGFGDLVLEVSGENVGRLAITYTLIGEVLPEPILKYADVRIPLLDAIGIWKLPLERVFHTVSKEKPAFPDELTDIVPQGGTLEEGLFHAESIYVNRHKVIRPKVFIPVFPGTNCEYDSARAFEDAGAEPCVKVFRNLSAEDIRSSVDEFTKAIEEAQMIMFPGGFSAGDEPEGSAKFFATAFRNEKLKEAVMRLTEERDGLVLGICNGFQALIKLGLVPYGKIIGQKPDSPTLTYNTIGRHISKMVYTKVVSDKSPWFLKAELGGVYCNPASHGEGRFVASEDWIRELLANGQIATRYVAPGGQLLRDEEWNVNGSYYNIEGITSPDGRILGKMAHCERRGDSVAVNIYGEQDIKIFASGVEYFR